MEKLFMPAILTISISAFANTDSLHILTGPAACVTYESLENAKLISCGSDLSPEYKDPPLKCYRRVSMTAKESYAVVTDCMKSVSGLRNEWCYCTESVQTTPINSVRFRSDR